MKPCRVTAADKSWIIMTDISGEEQALSRDRRKSIGAFFTPDDQADFMVRQYGLHQKWAEGASILDPTAGKGSLLESLIRVCREDGVPLTNPMLGRLKGIEREGEFSRNFNRRIRNSYGIEFKSNPIQTGDIMLEKSNFRADILFGNPPWVNYTDLPQDEKEAVKPYFLKFGLAASAGELLLGNSRIDIAALIILKTLGNNLNSGGSAFFFSPLSLILNEGAHNAFRRGRLPGTSFSINEVWDYGSNEIFPGVTTRCGLIYIQRDHKMREVLPYHIMTGEGEWEEHLATPVQEGGSAYIIQPPGKSAPPEIPRIPIGAGSLPRQGINTGGRNSLFIFESAKPVSKGLCEVRNNKESALLPEDLVFPLITSKQFKGNQKAEKYIFLPYKQNGKILTEKELESYPDAVNYLKKHRDSLESRKGVMLRSQIERGYYWSLLGVGPYTFFPWKVVWESYGKKEFTPMLFAEDNGKPWIPNQSLQAYCPFKKKREALRILKQLKEPVINSVLKSHKMQGTCNWAQPGRIKVFLNITEDRPH